MALERQCSEEVVILAMYYYLFCALFNASIWYRCTSVSGLYFFIGYISLAGLKRLELFSC